MISIYYNFGKILIDLLQAGSIDFSEHQDSQVWTDFMVHHYDNSKPEKRSYKKLLIKNVQ